MIANSEKVAELTGRLEQEGLRFRSRRQLRRFLVKTWKQAHATEVKQLRTRRIEASPLVPAITTRRDGTMFKIYGAAHGQRRVARMGPRVRHELRTLLEQAEKIPHSDYATERGFARLLGLPREKELDYIQAVFRRVGLRGLLAQLGRIFVALPLLPLMRPLFALSRDPLVREIRSALQDPTRLSRVARLWTLTRLPARIRIELEGESFVIVHSQEMARAIFTLARERELESLTVLVGLAHSDEIAYFLETDPLVG